MSTELLQPLSVHVSLCTQWRGELLPERLAELSFAPSQGIPQTSGTTVPSEDAGARKATLDTEAGVRGCFFNATRGILE